jgi:4-amino-4-deoxy-L-arabinose transferase-like glycosyltransferase
MVKKIARLWENPWRTLVVIIIVSVLLRMATSIIFFGNGIQELPGTFDEVSYHNLAQRVLDGYGFRFGEGWWPGTAANEPTAHWSFLYTGYLLVVYGIFGAQPLVARLLQSLLVGILMPLLLYRISLRTFAGAVAHGRFFAADPSLRRAQQIGLVSAAISAVYAYLFYYAAALITETFYICAILWSFDLALQIAQRPAAATWRTWLLLGLALAITVLLRQLFLIFVPFLLLWLWWAGRPRPFFKLGIPLVVILLLMLPWTIRNYYAFDTFVPLNTNSGYAFFWGNHPRYGTQFIPILPPGEYGRMIPQELRAQNLNEAEMDSALLSEALKFIIADPVRYIRLSISRIPSYFIFWPSADSSTVSNVSRVLSFGLFLPFMLFGLFLSLRPQQRTFGVWLQTPFVLFYLFMLFYTGIHLLTWTLVRYRIPVDAVLILFAGWALVHIGEWIAARQGGERPHPAAP